MGLLDNIANMGDDVYSDYLAGKKDNRKQEMHEKNVTLKDLVIKKETKKMKRDEDVDKWRNEILLSKTKQEEAELTRKGTILYPKETTDNINAMNGANKKQLGEMNEFNQMALQGINALDKANPEQKEQLWGDLRSQVLEIYPQYKDRLPENYDEAVNTGVIDRQRLLLQQTDAYLKRSLLERKMRVQEKKADAYVKHGGQYSGLKEQLQKATLEGKKQRLENNKTKQKNERDKMRIREAQEKRKANTMPALKEIDDAMGIMDERKVNTKSQRKAAIFFIEKRKKRFKSNGGDIAEAEDFALKEVDKNLDKGWLSDDFVSPKKSKKIIENPPKETKTKEPMKIDDDADQRKAISSKTKWDDEGIKKFIGTQGGTFKKISFNNGMWEVEYTDKNGVTKPIGVFAIKGFTRKFAK